jgi:hypothetical protein
VRRFAGFEEVAVGEEDGVVVAEGPQADVEEPVGVLDEGVRVPVQKPGETTR